MSRSLRTLIAGYPHHLVQRGHDRQAVFASDQDYAYYLDNLAEQLALREVTVYAYCLMTNHVHLLLEPRIEGDDISKLMRVVAARQTRYVNRLEGRTGTLWEGRFKSSVVDRDAWLWACCRYIELNPVRAGMVSHPGDYRWSSYRQHIDASAAAVTVGPLPLSSTGDFSSYLSYVSTVVEMTDDALIRTALSRNQCTGNDRFRRQIEEKLGRRLSNRGPGRPKNNSDPFYTFL